MSAPRPIDPQRERDCAWCEFPESVVGPLRAVPLYGETHELCAHCCKRYLGTPEPTLTRAEEAPTHA